jgi:hypothetical protein
VEVTGRLVQGVDVPARELKRRFAMLSVLVAVGLFLGMLAFLELGRQFGVQQVAEHGPAARVGVGVVDGVVFSLTALLVGFAFSGAASRFDHRRELVADEVKATGTAWKRIDTLTPQQQLVIRDDFRRYVDALIAWYGEAPGAAEALRAPSVVALAQDAIWSRSVAACATEQGERARMLLLPALNDLFGAVEKERLARRIHPPGLIFAMLGITALASAFFGGYGIANGPTRPWMYMLGVAAAFSIAGLVILELEFPRLGLVRVDDMDAALVELRATMG